MRRLIWLRNDLRLFDNPLFKEGGEAVYLYFLDETDEWPLGSASKSWLHHSLKAFQKKVPLILRRGDPIQELPKIFKECEADELRFTSRFEPHGRRVDAEIEGALSGKVRVLPGNLLFQPGEIKNKSDAPFQVFTPFWKSCLGREVAKPIPAPKEIQASVKIPSLKLEELELLPKIPWDKSFYSIWNPGEEGAIEKVKAFLAGPVVSYKERRDFPGLPGVSQLSPHLHFGEVSLRALYHAVKRGEASDGANCFLSELGWREFAHHLLAFFPKTTKEPLHEKYRSFPWRKDPKSLLAWQKGMTGFPIVDAGMRELWKTGWMHNRVRMIVGSFLTKDLLIPWQEGARWFWDTLVDADLASNTLGWQWVAGCGADAQPFFRIFNPITQGEKFDPKGEYIRKWVPELRAVPDAFIHAPWNYEGPIGYPKPIVDHSFARERALEALSQVK